LLAIDETLCYPRRDDFGALSKSITAWRQMLKPFGSILLWLLGLLLVLVNFNLNDPHLVIVRGCGAAILLAGSFAGLGLLLWRGYWTSRGIAGKLLVVLWCLPGLAMASAEAVFQWRKQAVLHAEAGQARDLGQHFIVGYTSFDEVAALAAKGLIGGVYVARHNISGRTADALKSELSNLQAIRLAASFRRSSLRRIRKAASFRICRRS
jgi:beta-N-acetylhexosaminidase